MHLEKMTSLRILTDTTGLVHPGKACFEFVILKISNDLKEQDWSTFQATKCIQATPTFLVISNFILYWVLSSCRLNQVKVQSS